MAMMTRLATTVASRYYPVPDLLDAFFMDGRTSGRREARSADVTTDKEDKAFLFAVFSHAPAQGWDPSGDPAYEASMNDFFQDLKSGRKSLDDEIGSFINMAVSVTGRMRLQSEHNRNPFFSGIIIKDAEAFAVTMGNGLAFLYRDDVLYPLTSTDIPIEPINFRGQKVNSFTNFCATKTATALCSNIAQLKMDDCLIICSQSVYDALGQRELLRLMDEAYDQSDAAGTIITAAAAKAPGVPLQVMISFVESVTAPQKGGGLFGRGKKKKQQPVVVGDDYYGAEAAGETPVNEHVYSIDDDQGVPPDFIPASGTDASPSPAVDIPQTDSVVSSGVPQTGNVIPSVEVPQTSPVTPNIEVPQTSVTPPSAEIPQAGDISAGANSNFATSQVSQSDSKPVPSSELPKTENVPASGIVSDPKGDTIPEQKAADQKAQIEDDEITTPSPVLKSPVEKVGLLSVETPGSTVTSSPIAEVNTPDINNSGITFIADQEDPVSLAENQEAKAPAASTSEIPPKEESQNRTEQNPAAPEIKQNIETIQSNPPASGSGLEDKDFGSGFSFVKEEIDEDDDDVSIEQNKTFREEQAASFQQFGKTTEDGFFIPFETDEQQTPIASATEDIPDMPLYDAPTSPPTYPDGSYEPAGFDMTGAYARGTYRQNEEDEDADVRIYGSSDLYQEFEKGSGGSGGYQDYTDSYSPYERPPLRNQRQNDPYAQDQQRYDDPRGDDQTDYFREQSGQGEYGDYEQPQQPQYQQQRNAPPPRHRNDNGDQERRYDFDDSDPAFKRNRIIMLALISACVIVFVVLIINVLNRSKEPATDTETTPVAANSQMTNQTNLPDGTQAQDAQVQAGTDQGTDPAGTQTTSSNADQTPDGMNPAVETGVGGLQVEGIYTFSENLGYMTWWDLFHYVYEIDLSTSEQENGYVRKLCEFSGIQVNNGINPKTFVGMEVKLPPKAIFDNVQE